MGESGEIYGDNVLPRSQEEGLTLSVQIGHLFGEALGGLLKTIQVKNRASIGRPPLEEARDDTVK